MLLFNKAEWKQLYENTKSIPAYGALITLTIFCFVTDSKWGERMHYTDLAAGHVNMPQVRNCNNYSAPKLRQ